MDALGIAAGELADVAAGGGPSAVGFVRPVVAMCLAIADEPSWVTTKSAIVVEALEVGDVACVSLLA